MRNRRLESSIRWIERCIEKIDKPNIFGDLRTISPTAKTRKLQNLISKLAECQSLVQSETDQEWVNGIAQTLKERVMQTLNPPMIT